MNTNPTDVWSNDLAQQLVAVLTVIDDGQVMQNFLRDVMTEKEILEISARFEAARMLVAGVSYVQITQKTKLSSRTVARISDWLKNGCNGYQAALQLNVTHQAHLPPARA